MPPTRNKEEATEAIIVSELGKEFNVDEVYGTESSYIGSLKSVIEFNPVEIPPSAPLAFDELMLEVCIFFPQFFKVLSFLFIKIRCGKKGGGRAGWVMY